jgi:hypothetical protein
MFLNLDFFLHKRSDRVYFFDLMAKSWIEHLSLHSSLQKCVSHVQFRRGGSTNDVLVACDRGVCVWSVRWQEKSASVRVLEDGCSGDEVLGMDSSPDGLFVAACRRKSLSVFDINAGSCLTFSGKFGETCCFSSDRAFLVCSANRGLLRVWSTLDWKERLWAVPPLKQPCLVVSSAALAVCYHEGGRFFSRLALDRCEEGDIYEGSFCLPLPVRHLALSPCGRRLAVVFEGSDCVVGVADTGNSAASMSLGCVRAQPEWGQPQQVVFRSSGPGALLAIVWSSGTISFVEMII